MPSKNSFHEDKYHEGSCCSGCIGEMEADTGYWPEYGCCCYTGMSLLEQWDYEPRYKPVNGSPPPEYRFFGDKTKKRWIARFRSQLGEHIRVDYYSNAGTNPETRTRITNTETGEIW